MAKRTEQRKAWLHGLFTTALEGGIGYWSAAEDYHIWQNPGAHWSKLVPDTDGFSVKLHPGEGEWGMFDDHAKDVAPLDVNIDVIATGVTRFKEWMAGEKRNRLGGLIKPDSDKEWLRDPAKPGNDYWLQFLRSERTNGDDGDYDADVADAIVQLGLFNEVVFG